MYDKKTNDRVVKAYLNPAVGEYIPRKAGYRKKSIWDNIKALFK